MDPSRICPLDIDLLERRQFKKEATLDKTAVEITDADGLVVEKMIVTCGLCSNMDSFTVLARFGCWCPHGRGRRPCLSR